MIVARAAIWINGRFGLRLWVWAGLLAALAVLLDTLPLFDLLGYDFSFAIGLATALAAVDVGHGVVKKGGQAPLGRLVLWACLGSLGLLVLPLLLSLGNAVRVRNCSIRDGLVFYALLPVGTALVAAPAGVLAGILVPVRGLSRIVAWAVPLASVLWSLVRLYFDPPVFALDAFGGYFPGPIYDEALRPTLRLFWFRLANLTWAATAVAAVGWLTCRKVRALSPPRLGWLAATIALAGASMLWAHYHADLRFHLSKADLARVLSRRASTQHFVIHSDPTADTPAELALFERDLEFRYFQLREILGVEPPGPITVYRFASGAEKKDLVGAGGTLYAKPWTREIFVQSEHFPSSRLRHELAHVFASAFGDKWFGVAFAWHFWGPFPVPKLAVGLIEGVAEAADFGDPGGRMTLHQEARAMIAAGQAPALETLIGLGFSAQSGARAYIMAGSFCRFLLDRYGAQRLRELYHSAGEFERVYGLPLSDLGQQWRAFLETQPLDTADRERARERFRQPAIFHKVCARELAARVSEAQVLMGSAPDEALHLFDSVCRDNPGEPAYELDRAEALAAAGASERALFLLEPMAGPSSPWTWPLRTRAANLAAAIHFHAGRFEQAKAAVELALRWASDDNDERSAQARLRALTDETSRKTLGRVLFGDSLGRDTDPGLVVHLVDEFAQAEPNDALGLYLVGRQLSWRDPALAKQTLRAACPQGTQVLAVALPAAFQRECERLLGETAFLAGDLSLARESFQRLRDQARSDADRLRALDFLQRIEWQEAMALGQIPAEGP